MYPGEDIEDGGCPPVDFQAVAGQVAAEAVGPEEEVADLVDSEAEVVEVVVPAEVGSR